VEVGEKDRGLNSLQTTTTKNGTISESTVCYGYTSLTIYIPPEFTPPVDWTIADTSNIVTTIGNDYGYIYVWKADVKDPFGPNWWVIYIWSPVSGGGWGDAQGIKFTANNMLFQRKPISLLGVQRLQCHTACVILTRMFQVQQVMFGLVQAL
jgi:hypothetical protein